MFQLCGKIPDFKILLNNLTTGSKRVSLPNLMNSFGIKSIPGCLLFLCFVIPVRNSLQVNGKSSGPSVFISRSFKFSSGFFSE